MLDIYGQQTGVGTNCIVSTKCTWVQYSYQSPQVFINNDKTLKQNDKVVKEQC